MSARGTASGGRLKVILTAASALVVIGAVALFALHPWHSVPHLPSNASIARETFGTGVTPGMGLEEAKDLAKSAPMEVRFVTREELALHDMYAERRADGDLVAAIYTEDRSLAPQPQVLELRAYLAAPKQSKAKLAGKPAAALTPQDVQQLFGTPANRAAAKDGRTHLTYYFAAPDGKQAYNLVTSHESDGHCFALELSLTTWPPE